MEYMNEGLEELKRLPKAIKDTFKDSFKIIENELKQAQKDREVLNVFKNALTIKQTCVLPKEESSDNTFIYACKYLYEITQSNLDEKLRKSLREWVLKNAFQEEIKENEQYKVIEKELGISLVTLFKALKDGCCFKPWSRVYYDKHIKIEYEVDKWKLYDVFDNDYNICDYGKTWALTRKELEK